MVSSLSASSCSQLIQTRSFWRRAAPKASSSPENTIESTNTTISSDDNFTDNSNNIINSNNDINTSIPEQPLSAAEQEMAKFEQNASTTVESAAEASIATTNTNVWEATWWPQDQMVDFIIYAHDMSGLNYALTIGAITLSFRTLMLPMFIKAQQNSARMAHVKPEMDVIKAKVDRLDPKDIQKQQEYAKEMQRLFQKFDVNPFRSILLPFVQMPVFMSIFFALRKMPDYFPEELSTGGILWFTDLTAPDPYYALPIFSGISFLAMMEISKKSMLASSPEHGKMLLTFFRGMAVLIIPFSAYFPTAVLTYWTVNNTFSFVQSAAFNNESMRRKLGIWDLPKPVPGAAPSKGMIEMIQDTMNSSRKDGNQNNLKERIELHNAAVDAKKKKNRRQGK